MSKVLKKLEEAIFYDEEKEKRIQKALAQARILMLEKYNLWEYLFVMLNDFEEFVRRYTTPDIRSSTNYFVNITAMSQQQQDRYWEKIVEPYKKWGAYENTYFIRNGEEVRVRI